MKVCYVCTDLGIPLHGHKGASSHVRGWLGALAAAGHEAVVAMAGAQNGTFRGHRTLALPPPALAASPDLAVSRDLRRALRHVWNNVTAEPVLRETFARERPAFVYERYSPFAACGPVVAREMGIPHLLEVNSPLAREGREHRGQALPEAASALELAAFRATSRIVAVSEILRDEIALAGIARDKIAVVPNGVDTRMFAPDGPALRVTQDPEALVLGFVGSLKPWHGLDVLAAAFRRLARADARLRLLVLGDGPARGVLEALRADLGERVHLAGAVPQEEVASHLRGIDVALAPYPAMPGFYFSPLKVLEYMAAGRALVASSIGQIAQIVRHRETGVLVAPGDVDALVAATRELTESREARARLGARAAAVAEREHDWSERIARVLEVAREAGVPGSGAGAPRRVGGGAR